MVRFEIPVKTVSESNLREHWRARMTRSRGQRQLSMLATRQAVRCLIFTASQKFVITITRIGARKLDGDNLANSQKHVRDGIADALGIDDGSDRLDWRYAQRRGKPREYSVEVQIE